MIVGPDHPDRGRAGVAVITEQVVAYGLDQAGVGGLVVSEWLGEPSAEVASVTVVWSCNRAWPPRTTRNFCSVFPTVIAPAPS